MTDRKNHEVDVVSFKLRSFGNGLKLWPSLPGLRVLSLESTALIMIAGVVLGVAILIFPFYTPLILVVAFAAIALIVVSFRKPIWSLYTALFILFLPIGLLPPHIHQYLNRSAAFLSLVVWVFAVISRRNRVIWTNSTVLMFGFLAWCVLTLLWAKNLEIGLTNLGMYSLRFVLFLILIPNLIRTKENIDGLMNTLAFNGWLLLFVCFGVILLGGYMPDTRFTIFSENSNGLGMLVMLTLPAILWQTMQTSKKYNTLMLLSAIIFLMGAIFLIGISGSRGSTISLIVTSLAFWIWKPTRLWGKLSLLILIVAVIFVPFIYSTTLERFTGKRGGTLLGGREILWQTGWNLITEHPLRGVGIGNSSFEIIPNLNAWEKQDEGGVAIHNPIIVIWSETGTPGIILFIGVLISAALSFLRQFKKHHKIGIQWLMPYYALVASTFLGYMVSWIKGGGMQASYSYFLMIGFLLIPSCLDIKSIESDGN